MRTLAAWLGLVASTTLNSLREDTSAAVHADGTIESSGAKWHKHHAHHHSMMQEKNKARAGASSGPPWQDSVTLKNRGLVYEFGTIVEKSNDKAQEEMYRLRDEFTKEFQKKNKPMVMNQNYIESEANSLEIEQVQMLNRVDEDLSRLVPPIKNEKNKIKGQKKLAAKSFKDQEKAYDNNVKADQKYFSNLIKTNEKKRVKYFKYEDKDVKALGKLFDKKTGKEHKKLSKRLSKINKNYDKDVSTMDKNMDNIKEGLMDNVEGYTEATASTDMLAEDLSNKVDKMLTSGDVTQMGVGPALERADEARSKWMDESQQKLDLAEGASAIRLSDMVEDISGSIKDAFLEGTKTSMAADKDVAQTATDGERIMTKLTKEAGKISTELEGKQREQRRKTQLVDRAMSAAQNQLTEAKDQGSNGVAAMKDDVHGKIEGYTNYVTQELGKIESAQFGLVDQKRKSLLSDMDSQQATIEGDNNMASGTVASDFETELATAVGMANQEQAKLDNLDIQTQRSGATLNKIESGTHTLGVNIAGLKTIGQNAAEAAQATVKNTEELTGKQMHSLSAQLLAQSKFVSTQANDAQTIMGKAKTEFLGALGEENMKTTDGVNEFVEHGKEAEKALIAKSRPVNAKMVMAAGELKDVNNGIKKATIEAARMRDRADQDLEAARATATQASDAAAAMAKSRVDQSRQGAEQMISDVQSQMNNALAQQSKSFDGQATEVRSVINKASADFQSRQSAQQSKLNALSATLHGEVERLDAIKMTVGSEHEKRMQSISDSEVAVEAAQRRAVAELSAFKDSFTGDVEKDYAAFLLESHDTTSKFQKGVEDKLAATGTFVSNQRTQALKYFDDSESSVNGIIMGADGKYKTVHGQEVSFAKFLDSNTAGADAIKQAENSLNILGGTDAERAKTAVGLEADAQKASTRMSDEITHAGEDGQASLRAAQNAASGDLAESRKLADEERQKFRGELGNSNGEITKEMSAMQDQELALRRAFATDGQKVQQDLSHGTIIVNQEEAAVQGAERKEMSELAAQKMRDNRDRAAAVGEAAAVDRDLKTQATGVQSEVNEVSNAMNSAITSLNPGPHLARSSMNMEQLKQLQEMARKTSMNKESELEASVQQTQDRITEIIKEGQEEAALVSKRIIDASKNSRDTFADVSDRFRETDEDTMGLTKEMKELAQDLSTASMTRINLVKDRYERTKDDVDRAMDVAKYQGDDAVKGVIALMGESQQETDKITAHKDNVLMPEATVWRGEIQRVFESMGMGLDMERIARLAAESMAAEGENGSILSAEQEMELKIRNLVNELSTKTKAIMDKAAAMIAEIEAMSHLSREEKDKRIAAIRQQAQIEAQKLRDETKRLIAAQRQQYHSIDEDLIALDGLMQRANQLAEGHDGSAASHALVLELQQELSKKMKSIRERFITGMSLMQEQQMRDEVAEPHVLPAALKYQEAAAAFSALEAARKPEDREWEHALSVMEKAAEKMPNQT